MKTNDMNIKGPQIGKFNRRVVKSVSPTIIRNKVNLEKKKKYFFFY